MNEAAHKDHRHQNQKHGAQDLSQTAGEPLRVEGHHKGRGKKDQGVDQLEPGGGGPGGEEGGYCHLKGCTGSAGDGQAGADGQIDQNGEDGGKQGMDPAGQGIQTACPDHGDDAQNGQADGADGQTGHGGPGLYSGLGP